MKNTPLYIGEILRTSTHYLPYTYRNAWVEIVYPYTDHYSHVYRRDIMQSLSYISIIAVFVPSFLRLQNSRRTLQMKYQTSTPVARFQSTILFVVQAPLVPAGGFPHFCKQHKNSGILTVHPGILLFLFLFETKVCLVELLLFTCS